MPSARLIIKSSIANGLFAAFLASHAVTGSFGDVVGKADQDAGCLDLKCIAEVIARTPTMAPLIDPSLSVSLSEHLLVFTNQGKIMTLAIGERVSPGFLANGETPTLAPDGKTIAFWSSDKYGRQLWLVDLHSRKARRVTSVKGGLISPTGGADIQSAEAANRIAWSPSGDRVIVSIATIKSHPVTPSEPWLGKSGTASKPPLTFSYKERQRDPWKLIFHPSVAPVAFWDKTGEHDQLVEIDLPSGETKPVRTSFQSYIAPAWSPDGHTVAAIERDLTTPQSWRIKQKLALIDLQSGAIRYPEISGWIKLPTFSPDGKSLSLIQQAPDILGFPHLDVLDVQSGTVREIAASGVVDWNGGRWDAGQLSYLQRQDLRSEIWSATPQRLLSASFDGVIDDFAVAGHRTFAIVHSPAAPVEIGEIKDGRLDPFYVKPSQESQDELATLRALHWRSADGSTIDGILLLPRKHRDLPPVILDPYPGMARYTFYAGMHVLGGNALFLKNGYAIFYMNPRTPHSVMSYTRDERFGRSAVGPAGLKLMVADIASGLKYLRQTGLVDGQRIMAYGHSNAAMTLIDLLPRYDGIKCAVIHNPALFGQESYFGTPDPTYHASWYGGPNIWDNPSFYEPFDPLAHIGTFNTPIFLIGATDDNDFEQSMFFNGMRSAGKPITYAVYVGDGHVPSDKNMVDYWWRVLAYFQHC